MKHITKLVVAFAVATLLIVGPASAHVRTAGTSLKLKASPTTVQKGKTVTFTATLNSNWKKCYSQRKVSFYKDGVKQFTKGTNNHGVATAKWKATKTGNWVAKFKGRKWGTHPHRHVCRASQSKSVKVTVKK